MFKILIPAIFLMGNAFGEFDISNIKLTPTELEIVGDSLEEIKSVAIISNDSRRDFEIENVSPNQVIARPLDNTTMVEWKALNLVITDSEKESTYPITISQKNGLVTFYKLQETKELDHKPSQDKLVLDHESEINFSPGGDSTGYDYNYSLYANPTGDFAIKGVDKDLFTIDNQGNVEISGTLKIKGKPVLFNFPYLPTNELMVTNPTNSNSGNKVVLSSGTSNGLAESGYTIPMNICPKGQILKSDGINFVCSLEASQEDQLGPVYTNQKSNFGIDQIYRDLQINNVVIGVDNSITGVTAFSSSGNMNVAAGAFVVDSAARNVGIGATPTYKLDIIGAVDSGIHIKQGAQATATGSAWRNGLVFENSSNVNSVSIGYGVGDLFSIIAYSGIPQTVFTLNSNGDGVIRGNLKIGAYTLPSATGGAGTVLKNDGAGTVSWGTVGGGTVNGPGITISGNIATWNSLDGTLLADGGKVAANLVTNAGAGTPGFVAKFGASGTVIQDGTKLEVDLVTGPASASAVDNLASFNNTNGKVIKDSGILSTNVMTMAAPATLGNVLSSTGGKGAADSGKLVADLVTMTTVAAPTLSNQLFLSTGPGLKQAMATAYAFPTASGSTGQVLKLINATTADWATVGGGDVVGQGASAVNEVAVYADSSGKLIKSVSISALNIVQSTATPTVPNHVAVFDSTTGKSIIDSGKLIGDLVTGPGGAGIGNLALYSAANGKTIQDSLIVSANVVQNSGTSTANAIARFELATGKIIKNSPVTIDDSGNLAGVGTINGKTATEFVTMAATPTQDDRVFLSTNGSKVLKSTTYSLPIGPCAQDYILKTNASGNFDCVAAASSGVVSFKGRTGAVVPVDGDYTGLMVYTTAVGAITSTTTQGAINELEAEKLALTGGTMTGTLITGSTTLQPSIAIGNVVGAAGELRFMEASAGPQYVGFKSPAILSGDTIWTLPPADGASGTVLSTDGLGILSWKTSSGGDVTGPAGAITAGNLAAFSGGTGKIISDTGILATNVVQGPATATSTSIALFNGITGKLIQSSVVSISPTGDMTGVGTISSSGNLTVNGTLTVNGSGTFSGPLQAQSYTNTSDRNLKKDITPFSGGDLIDKLMPVTFRWKKGDDRPVIGLIAQDVEKVLPDVITITKTKEGSIRSYDVGQVLALTIEALKETRAEVKMLQEKIKKLEQKNRKKGE